MEKVKLGEITKIRTGKLDANASDINGKYPFFTCSMEPLKINDYSYDCECILVAGNGDLNVKYYNGKFDAYQRTYIIEVKECKHFKTKYLYYLINNNIENLRKDAIGGVIKYIKLKNLTDIKVKNLGITEQEKIVNELDKVQEIIDIRKEQIEQLDELVKSQFVEMFEKNKNVQYKKIKDICKSIVRGPFGSALKKEFFVAKSLNTYKVYEQKNAINGDWNLGVYYIDEQKFNELKRFECKPKDIIMSCSGTIGKFYELPDNIEKGIINQALLKFTTNEEFVLSQYFIDYMRMHINQLDTKGSGLQNIGSVSYIKEMDIPIPKIQLQKKYLEFVEQVDKQKFELQKSLEEIQKLQESLMYKYFN